MESTKYSVVWRWGVVGDVCVCVVVVVVLVVVESCWRDQARSFGAARAPLALSGERQKSVVQPPLSPASITIRDISTLLDL